MFGSGNIIGRQVFIVFANPEVEKKFEDMEAYKKRTGGKVVGLDERGVWVENPDYDMGDVDGETGRKIPYRMICLIPWPCILTIMIFPELNPEKVSSLGFRKSKPRAK